MPLALPVEKYLNSLLLLETSFLHKRTNVEFRYREESQRMGNVRP
jgi:hypothetical protein